MTLSQLIYALFSQPFYEGIKLPENEDLQVDEALEVRGQGNGAVRTDAIIAADAQGLRIVTWQELLTSGQSESTRECRSEGASERGGEEMGKEGGGIGRGRGRG